MNECGRMCKKLQYSNAMKGMKILLVMHFFGMSSMGVQHDDNRGIEHRGLEVAPFKVRPFPFPEYRLF